MRELKLNLWLAIYMGEPMTVRIVTGETKTKTAPQGLTGCRFFFLSYFRSRIRQLLRTTGVYTSEKPPVNLITMMNKRLLGQNDDDNLGKVSRNELSRKNKTTKFLSNRERERKKEKRNENIFIHRQKKSFSLYVSFCFLLSYSILT